jgi:hypothetical protein
VDDAVFDMLLERGDFQTLSEESAFEQLVAQTQWFEGLTPQSE